MASLEEKWFLQFANETEEREQGRPWADGTAIAARKKLNQPPWDENCKVTPLIGGYAAMTAMREKLADAIGQAPRSGDFGKRGLVYICGWRFNPLRDLSDENVEWTSSATDGDDPTTLGMILRLMQAGIRVRALFWQPTTIQDWFGDYFSHCEEHFWIANIVRLENERLMKDRPGLDSEIGIVALDQRLPDTAASHHQKMMVVRVGSVQVAFCGGVDLAFTRRDAPNREHPFDPNSSRFMAGDWQSGLVTPAPRHTWPRQRRGLDYISLDKSQRPKRSPDSDLPCLPRPAAYEQKYQVWHDQHLMLEGPIVPTLEEQFGERWRDVSAVQVIWEVITPDRRKIPVRSRPNDVIFSTSKAFDSRTGLILPLSREPAQPSRPVPGATAKVQMWRTIPLRAERGSGLFQHGEYTVMAGVAKACKAARELIWIFDQYLWSQALARLLNKQIKDPKRLGLHVIIILPPHGDTLKSESHIYQHHARSLAILQLLDKLTSEQLARIAVYDLWHPTQKQGIYCHAKAQTYDGSLLVCGSANMNRRSFTCDTELSCAVLDPDVVSKHQQQLWDLLFPASPWSSVDLNGSGSGANFFSRFIDAAKEDMNPHLIRDPWMPGEVHELPTVPITPLQVLARTWMAREAFSLKFGHIYDHVPMAKKESKYSLDEWSSLIESPLTRKEWRRP